MAGILGVSCGAYYQRAKREASGVKKEGDKELIGLIRLIQERHHGRYGSHRVRETLALFSYSFADRRSDRASRQSISPCHYSLFMV
jgi:hypothetical protein